MTLFSRADDPWSHRTRIVLAEKSIHVETIDVQGGNLPEDLLDLKPYHTVPTLVDRDLVLYDSRVIIDYLTSAFRTAADAGRSGGARAVQARALSHRARLVQPGAADRRRRDRKQGQRARKILRDSILASTDVFKAKPYFLSTSSRWSTPRSRRSCGDCPAGRSTCRRRRR
jgi:RNA polymerase-associated protein